MTTVYNDPAEFTDEAVEGFVDLHADRLRRVPGGVVRRTRPAGGKVAVIAGGGSGHYPAFCGVVGPGFADAAVIGNIFTSPSTAQAYSVGRAAHSGKGVIFTYGNYAGDVMNFGLAGERLQADGIDARQVVVTDDVASAPAGERSKRRGIAGDVVVFKVLGAAAERGDDIDEVERLGRLANDRTFTIGVAFGGCTFPGADHPHFTVPEGKMGLGLGIHGEPGQRDVDWMPAPELADLLVSTLLPERPADASGRVGVIVNGLGRTKYEELFVLWNFVAKRLRAEGLELVGPEVGELVTSLDMGGVSLTLVWLDEELEPLWLAPADTPAFRRGSVVEAAAEGEGVEESVAAEEMLEVPEGDADSRTVATRAVAALDRMHTVIVAAEDELGRIDAIAGDGDHGRGMVRGVSHAVRAARAAADAGWGAGGVLEHAGDAWAEYAGGTSGVLWGAGLRALGRTLGNAGKPSAGQVVRGVEEFVAAIVSLGGAEIGDKTLVDAAVPFAEVLRSGAEDGAELAEAWGAAVRAAEEAAQTTAALSPKKGRARPLAERSVGTPDPGAISFALCAREAGSVLGADVPDTSALDNSALDINALDITVGAGA